MSQVTGVEEHVPPVLEDMADDTGRRAPYYSQIATDPDIAVNRISGAFFFGAASTVSVALEGIADHHKNFVIDFAAVPFIDSTAANAIATVVQKSQRRGVTVIISAASPAVQSLLGIQGVQPPSVRFEKSLDEALQVAHGLTHVEISVNRRGVRTPIGIASN